MAKDLEEESLRYEEAIEAVGGIHLFLGGVGVTDTSRSMSRTLHLTVEPG